MKRTLFAGTLPIVAALGLTMGCKRESDVQPVGGDTNHGASVQLEKVKQETKEAIAATKDYAYTQKSEYAAKIRMELANLNRELDQLSAKVESSSESIRADAKIKLQEVREKLARLNAKLDGVPSATESTWEEVKAGVKTGYEEVKDSFKQARQWLSEKIAP